MRPRGIKSVLLVVVLAGSLLSVVAPVSAANSGQVCNRVGATSTDKSRGKTVKLICAKVGKKLLWVEVAVLSPTTTVLIVNGYTIEPGANLKGAVLTNADLTKANLKGANLQGADLYAADLTNANLTNANLFSAYLVVANLNGANLNGANLNSANLHRAHLHRADLSYADLSYADLSYAHLAGADLTGATRPDGTPWTT